LSGKLPYDDHEFDYITCIEGLEHIENPHQAIREFNRLLKVAGHLVISVPNVLNIEERLKWLLYGYTSHFKPLSPESIRKLQPKIAGRAEMALHIHPIAYPELRYLFQTNDFELLHVYRDKAKSKLWLYWPMVAFIRLLAKLTPKPKRIERWTDELHSDEVLLGGNTLIVHAIKKQG